MDKIITNMINSLREILLGSDTKPIRDTYFANAERVIHENSYFNWFTARIAVWRLRRARARMDQTWSLLLDPKFHQTVINYMEQLEPVIEKVISREMGDSFEDFQEKWEDMDGLDIKEMFTRSKDVARS